MKSYLILFLTISLVTGSLTGGFAQGEKEGRENETEADTSHPGMDANDHMRSRSIESMAQAFESSERDAWQKPDEVIKMMGEVKGKTIMDIGSGTGYFSFRLADAGASVICADVDSRFLALIEEKKTEGGYSDEQIQIRQVPYDSPELEEGEVDMVIIVNTYHHIERRERYFSRVKSGMKEGGKLFVVDFFKKELDFGPPVSMKVSEQKVLGELFEAGFRKFVVDTDLLPNQFIVIAE